MLFRSEWTQAILGGSIIPLATLHVVGTRVGFDYFGIQSGYPWVLGSLVSGGWWGIARQFSLPFVVWIHACIGIHFAWRLRSWYRDWLPVLYGIALLVPAAGIAGAAIALRDFAELAERPGFLENLFAKVNAPDAPTAFQLYMISDSLIGEQRFVQPRAWQPVGIMVTYHLAQALLVLSLVS